MGMYSFTIAMLRFPFHSAIRNLIVIFFSEYEEQVGGAKILVKNEEKAVFPKAKEMEILTDLNLN